MTTPYARLPLPKETSLAELYHENTKHPAYVRDAPARGGPEEFPPPESLAYGEPAPLPEGPRLGALHDLVLARRSARAFSGGAATLPQLSTLLALSYGVTGPLADGTPGRAAPSAGARYPLELFVAALRVDGLAPGLWHYRPEAHGLEAVRAGDLADALDLAFFRQAPIRDAALVVLLGAAMGRTMVKYGDRGYRLVLLDAGHAAQNLLLAATAMGLGASPLGGFVDDELNDLAGLNGVDENVVYAVVVGTP